MGVGLYKGMIVSLRFVFFLVLVNLVSTQAGANDFKILALGDSLTAGYGLNKGDGFPEQLQKSLQEQGHKIIVLNAGVSGDTSQGGLARLNWALVDKPDMVILELGANDGLRGIAPSLMAHNLDQIISQLKARKIKILLAGMYAPPNFGDAYGQSYNAVFPTLAKNHKVTLYPFFLEGVAGNPDLNQDDGLHPTKEGIAVIVKQIQPYVLKVKEEKS